LAGGGPPLVARQTFGGGLYVVEVGLEVLCAASKHKEESPEVV